MASLTSTPSPATPQILSVVPQTPQFLSTTLPRAPRRKSKDLDRDLRLQILTLHEVGKFSMAKIAKSLSISYRQVRYAVQAGHPSPQKKTGRKSILSTAQIDEIESYVRQDRRSRQMTYDALVKGKRDKLDLSWYRRTLIFT